MSIQVNNMIPEAEAGSVRRLHNSYTDINGSQKQVAHLRVHCTV